MSEETIERYLELRSERDQRKRELTEMNKRLQKLENDVVDELLERGDRSVTRQDGVRVSLRRNFAISSTRENCEAIRSWLVDEFGDDSDFVEEAIRKEALTAKVKELYEEGWTDDDFPDAMKVSSRPGLSVYGLK